MRLITLINLCNYVLNYHVLCFYFHMRDIFLTAGCFPPLYLLATLKKLNRVSFPRRGVWEPRKSLHFFKKSQNFALKNIFS